MAVVRIEKPPRGMLITFVSVPLSVPITQKWKDELRKLTEAAKIKSNNNYTNMTSYQLPPGSRQGERPPPSRSGEVPPSRDGERPPPSRQLVSRQSEKLNARLGTRDGLQRPHPTPDQQQYQV